MGELKDGRLVSRKRGEYDGETRDPRLVTPDSNGGIMPDFLNSRRGITVLALVLLIIALAVGAYLLMRYLNPSTSL